MKNINLIGGGFQHAYSSVWWKYPKDIFWLKDNSSDISIYIDSSIKNGINDGINVKKYAWLHESRHFHNMTDWIIYNKEEIERVYEMLFTHDEYISTLSDKFIFIPGNGFWIETPKIYEKSKILSMVTSNKNETNGHKMRHDFINKYRNNMDLYGRGFKEINLKEEGLNDYMFSIVIENDNYDTYFSEKILDCFATGTIPIYWGTRKITNYFDENGIIFIENLKIEDLNKELYMSKIESIKYNFEKVLDYEITEDFIYKKYIKQV